MTDLLFLGDKIIGPYHELNQIPEKPLEYVYLNYEKPYAAVYGPIDTTDTPPEFVLPQFSKWQPLILSISRNDYLLDILRHCLEWDSRFFLPGERTFKLSSYGYVPVTREDLIDDQFIILLGYVERQSTGGRCD